MSLGHGLSVLISLDLQHIISPHTGHTLISNRVLTFISINIRLLNTVHAQYSWVSPSPHVTLPFGVFFLLDLLTYFHGTGEDALCGCGRLAACAAKLLLECWLANSGDPS